MSEHLSHDRDADVGVNVGVNVTLILGMRRAPMDRLEEAFRIYQLAFTAAVEKPCVKNWRAAVEACEAMQKAAKHL